MTTHTRLFTRASACEERRIASPEPRWVARDERPAHARALRHATLRHGVRRVLRLPRFVRFGAVGGLNTVVDVLAFNLLVWMFNLHEPRLLALANGVAYALGAINSFALNRSWTFGRRAPVTSGELARFTGVTLAGATLNTALVWLLGQALTPALGSTALWANVVKFGALGGSTLVSYIGMRLWVFARRPPAGADASLALAPSAAPGSTRRQTQALRAQERDQRLAVSRALARQSLSVVLPAYNEEQAIEATLREVMSALDAWGADYEVIVVNDGSADRTGRLVAGIAERAPQVRLLTHATNRGYGAALASGFAAATKSLTFFMDADGQFTIHDLPRLLAQSEGVDAVLGFRIHRQDAWPRLVNAWLWRQAVYLALGVRVRDLDCAFKLIRSDILRAYPPTTGSALINAELVYTLKRIGARYREVGVRHLPRRGGRATGANLRVIVRALWDLVTHAWAWRRRAYLAYAPVAAR